MVYLDIATEVLETLHHGVTSVACIKFIKGWLKTLTTFASPYVSLFCHKLASVHGCCVGREEGAWYIKLSRSSCECLFEVTHNSITKEFCKDSKKS